MYADRSGGEYSLATSPEGIFTTTSDPQLPKSEQFIRLRHYVTFGVPTVTSDSVTNVMESSVYYTIHNCRNLYKSVKGHKYICTYIYIYK